MLRLFLSLLLLPVISYGQQNLVPNGDFEQYTEFLTDENPVSIAYRWGSTGAVCTPDYFNIQCPPLIFDSDTVVYCGVPVNNRGYQYAKSGFGYAGIHAFSLLNEPNGREFIQVELDETIHAGVRYQVSFHVSLADKYKYAVSTIGAYFSDTPIVRYEYSITDLGLVPQVNSTEGIVFDDKENWTEVRDTFNSRYGGERFLVIGNFNLDGESGVVLLESGERIHAYYYIDDVSVIALDSIPSSIGEPERLSFSVFPNPATDVIRIVGVEQQRHLRLADLRGREVMTEEVSGHDHSLKIGHLPAGLYILEVTATDGRRATQRVIKMAGP